MFFKYTGHKLEEEPLEQSVPVLRVAVSVSMSVEGSIASGNVMQYVAGGG